MDEPKAVLIAHRDVSLLEALLPLLPRPEWVLKWVEDGCQMWMLLEKLHYDVVLAELPPSSADRVDWLRRIRQLRPAAKVIVLAEKSEPADVIRSIREHAFSFFGTPFEPGALAEMITRATHQPSSVDGIQVLSASTQWVQLRVRSRLITAERAVQFFREMETDLPVEEREGIAIAFREMLLNAMEHGTGFDPNQTIEVSYVRTSRTILYSISDPGEGFSFDSLPHAAVSNPSDSPAQHLLYRMEHGIRAGGFGVLVAKNLVDEVVYNEKGNQVLLIKYLR